MGERTGGTLKRRGLLAGAAALLGAGLAKLARTERVQAAHDGGPDQTVLHADEQNTTSGTTTIFRSGGAGVTTLQVYNSASGGVAVVAHATGTGIGGAGLYGVNNTPASGDFANTVGGVGVFGFNNSTEPTARGIGVWGQVLSATGVGVRGENRADNTNAVGVQGVSQNTDSGALLRGIGVQGLSGAGTGVRGASTSSFGVYGLSQSGVGAFGGSNSSIGVYASSNTGDGVFSTAPKKAVWGRTVVANGIGVFGQATNVGGFGVYGAAPTAANTWAGYFEGHVFVSGGLAGGDVATTAAQAADGSQRTLYSVDSAEPVVEDFGRGRLTNGLADVRLDPDFVATTAGDAYMVFLTEEGDHNALFVENKSPAAFTVRAKGSPTAASAFNYRVVAKRKGATGKRLERVARPRGLSPQDLEPPKPPDVPPMPERPTGPRPEPPRPGRQDAR